MDDENSGEYWQRPKVDREKREFKPALESELELLKTFRRVEFKTEVDAKGEVKYIIEVPTDRGIRTVDWWVSTGEWKVRSGRGSGKGMYSLGRYFQIIPPKGYSGVQR